MKKIRIIPLVLIAALLLSILLSGCQQVQIQEPSPVQANVPVTEAPTAAPTEAPTEKQEEAGPIIEPQRIADYLFEYGELPDNFLTKQEARDLGWDSRWNDLSDVAPGMSIGGDRFGNYDGNLPRRKGVRYYEADCWYTGGHRGAERIVWSTEGRVWYTDDHYQTFTEMYSSGR